MHLKKCSTQQYPKKIEYHNLHKYHEFFIFDLVLYRFFLFLGRLFSLIMCRLCTISPLKYKQGDMSFFCSENVLFQNYFRFFLVIFINYIYFFWFFLFRKHKNITTKKNIYIVASFWFKKNEFIRFFQSQKRFSISDYF